MQKLKFLIILILGFFSLCFAADSETLTITTYYPSPYGSYNQLYVKSKLGIGTTSPAALLDIRKATTNSGDVAFFGNVTGGIYGSLGFGTGGSGYFYLGDTGNSPRLAIQSGGNVGIGTTSPIAPLHVNSPTTQGHIVISGLSDSGHTYSALYLTDNNALPNTNSWVIAHKKETGTVEEGDFHIGRWINPGNERGDFIIDKDTGNVGIGTTTPNSTKGSGYLDVKDVYLRDVSRWASADGDAPDYDSGWYAENSNTSHKTTLTHNLGAIPTRIQIWFSPDNPPSNWVYPVSADSANYTLGPHIGYYRNPISIRVNTTTVEYYMYNAIYMYAYTYSNTWTWDLWTSGYYRVRLWK